LRKGVRGTEKPERGVRTNPNSYLVHGSAWVRGREEEGDGLRSKFIRWRDPMFEPKNMSKEAMRWHLLEGEAQTIRLKTERMFFSGTSVEAVWRS